MATVINAIYVLMSPSNATHGISHYQVDSVGCFVNIYHMLFAKWILSALYNSVLLDYICLLWKS